MKALVIDDDIPTTQAIRDSIDWHAHSVTDVFIAHNIWKAKKNILEFMPEIIICDIEMPKGSGIDLIKWARERNIDSRFLILTCHEDFVYAAEAIRYSADAYITKPFDVKGMQREIAKTVEKINNQRQLHQYRVYGERWMSNLHVRETSFWRELLFGSIPPDMETIKKEIGERGIDCNASVSFRLLLCSVREEQLDASRDRLAFRHSMYGLVNEGISGGKDMIRTLDYAANGCLYVIRILGSEEHPDEVVVKCRSLLERCRGVLKCEATCYIGDEAAMDRLAASRAALEETDAYNIVKRGGVITNLADIGRDRTPYVFNGKTIQKYIREERGVEAVNLLRSELENLAAQDRLNSETMQSIQHDYTQIIYSILYDNNVQAHELFSDAPSQKLYQTSGLSVFDMMKWASYITEKTFQHIKEIRETETVVNKLKRFIDENYAKKITREDIASSVFLSPDYVSKIFRNETGLYIKDYLNEIRIQKAKQLIRDGKMNVSEAATYVGFDNFSYFSSLFKKSIGVSPSHYRKSDII